ncbi:hypothetical protein GCM10028806_33360 [Spirosoma terrae]|uniref:Helicase C-terminal domain-containing protein n=1 Tax=Spirosoma terrae TaxID=1968276 RepID=A0A6L9L948_9BACT|nr:helicase-related protein [Spirosoma terrae]NDU95651.1 hypothetical protein [Spirosoma terrae]
MNVKSLSPEQIRELAAISDVNKRKDGYQKLVVDFAARVRYLAVTMFTRGGKTVLTRRLVERYRAVQPNRLITVIVPTRKLKDDWETELAGIPNVEVWVIHTYVGTSGKILSEEHYQSGVLIVDEAHWVTGEYSMYYSTVLSKSTYDFCLLLSATLNEEQLTFLEKHGIQHRFDLPLKTGYLLGVVPPYETINLAVPLTPSEEINYIKAQEEYNQHTKFFEQYSERGAAYLAATCMAGKRITKFDDRTMSGNEWADEVANYLSLNELVPDPITGGQVIGVSFKWNAAMRSRNSVLYNAQRKSRFARGLLNRLGHQRILVFCSSIHQLEEIVKHDPLAQGYHSKLTKKQKKDALDRFYGGQFPHLISCKALNEGFTVHDVQWGINLSISSQSRELIQKIGRLLAYNPDQPDKQARMINLYVPDFTYKGVEYRSQEAVWLKKAQQGQMFVQYMTDPYLVVPDEYRVLKPPILYPNAA